MNPVRPHRRSALLGAAGAVIASFASRAQAAAPGAWMRLPTQEYAGKQDDIAFGSAERGWYGNGAGKLFRTDDGGDSWRLVWSRPGVFVRALGFVDDDHGIMGNVGVGVFPGVQDATPLYRTDDGGLGWAACRIEGPAPGGICGIDARPGAAILHAAGRVGGPAHYLRSFDGGASWLSADLSEKTAAIFDVRFLDDRTGFIAGATSAQVRRRPQGLILRTDDGGDTWREAFRSARPFETVWKLHFPSRRVGYGAIQSYDPDRQVTRRWFARTADGGRTWSEHPLCDDFAWRSFGVGFADERLGWIGGTAGGLETRDGGETWRPVEMGRAVNKIIIVGQGAARRAYAVGVQVHRLDLGAPGVVAPHGLRHDPPGG